MATVATKTGKTRKVIIGSSATPATGRKVREYAQPKASEKVANERKQAVKVSLESEIRVDVVLENLSLADVSLILEGLTNARKKYRTSPYGEVYGGAAKEMPYAQALVQSGRADRLHKKLSDIQAKVAKVTK